MWDNNIKTQEPEAYQWVHGKKVGDPNLGARMADQTTKPVLSKAAVPGLVHHVYGLEVTVVKQLNAYDDLNFHVQVRQAHANPFIRSVCPDGYTLKILNAVDSQKPAIVEAQNQLMHRFKDAGFNVPYPVATMDNAEWSLQTLSTTPAACWPPQTDSGPSTDHIVRLLVFIPGEMLHTVPYTSTLMFESGEMAARISNCLEDFDHPVYDTLESPFFLRNVPAVAQFTWVVPDPERRTMVEQAIQQFTERVSPVLDQLPQGALHGDLNEQNLLVAPDARGAHHLVGLLDFGDSHRSAQLFELALVVMYLMVDCSQMERLDVGGHVLAGYARHRRLTAQELALLQTCVCARFVQSLVLGALAYHQNPVNEYVLITATNGWTALKQIWQEPQERLHARWQRIQQQYRQ